MPLDAFCNTFAGGALDRASERRADADWLAARLADPSAFAIALWDGKALAAQDGASLTRLPGALAAELSRGADERRLFLGLDADGHAAFAVEIDGPGDPSQGALFGHGRFEGLRELAPFLPAPDAAMAATGRAVFEWSRRAGFCGRCGQPTRAADGGWRRVCVACKTEAFPRTDPVVIMLPVRGDQCLLGRQASFPAGRFSALAGFMEPGESIEEACAREVREEAGLEVLAVRYHSSQPWPFPFNLMIGLIADVAEGQAQPDLTELEAVRWLSRSEAHALLEGRHALSAPPPLAVAHQLIRTWAHGG